LADIRSLLQNIRFYRRCDSSTQVQQRFHSVAGETFVSSTQLAFPFFMSGLAYQNTHAVPLATAEYFARPDAILASLGSFPSTSIPAEPAMLINPLH
jgi:hypothetical protein